MNYVINGVKLFQNTYNTSGVEGIPDEDNDVKEIWENKKCKTSPIPPEKIIKSNSYDIINKGQQYKYERGLYRGKICKCDSPYVCKTGEF